MKKMDINFVIAVAALLCSVWALLLVLNHDRQGKKIIRANVEYLSGIYVRLDNAERAIERVENLVEEIDPSRTRHALEWHDLDARIRALEESIKDLEAISRYLGDAVGEDILPEVIRTTSGDRPEVRAIEEGKP